MSYLPVEMMVAISAAAGFFNPIPQQGEEGYQADKGHYLRVLYENDASFGTDCNYTHGTRVDYAQRIGAGPNWWGASLTQNIYTPTTHTYGSVRGQHPYGGYLAVGAAYMRTGVDVGASFEFQLGTSGKASLAEEAQHLVHAAGDMAQWNGWGDQVPGEVTFQLAMRQDVRLPWLESSFWDGWQTDGSFYLREEVGTVSIAGGVGMTFRFGYNLPPTMQLNGNSAADFGISLLQKPDYNPEAISYFATFSAGINYVARDMFVDGGVFHHFDQTCSRVPWQGEVRIGLGVRYQGIDYYMGLLYMSDTFRTQSENTYMGSFAIGWSW